MPSKPPRASDTDISPIAHTVIQSGAATTVACAVRYRVADRWLGGSGVAYREGPNVPRAQPWAFDLASVTKPFFAMAVHSAIVNGRLRAESTLSEMLPELADTYAANCTLDALLSHRTGLVPHVELFKVMQERRAVRKLDLLRFAANSALSDVARKVTPITSVYSDLNYFLLGAALENRFCVALDEWCQRSAAAFWPENVRSIRQWLAHTPSDKLGAFVPTEVVAARGGLLTGVVHDENAWLLSGNGMSGHAGLFGTADAVADFGETLLDALAKRDDTLSYEAVRRATARRPDNTLCAGFDRRANVGSSAGYFCSDDTFGHLGFTGTSLWCDPIREIVVVVLSNRVYPSRDNLRLRAIRPSLHDALFRWADEQRK